MSTPRKRTAAEATRVQQLRLLARVYAAHQMAYALRWNNGKPTGGTFAGWLRQYTQYNLSAQVRRRGNAGRINFTALVSEIRRMGTNGRAGESATVMAEAVVATRALVQHRQAAESSYHDRMRRLHADVRERYERAAARIITRALMPYAGWQRLHDALLEDIWDSRVEYDETVKQLTKEAADRQSSAEVQQIR